MALFILNLAHISLFSKFIALPFLYEILSFKQNLLLQYLYIKYKKLCMLYIFCVLHIYNIFIMYNILYIT